eukprot:CAMPEP_0171248386 /NCGR_PEP_ID=MMETSP0790-20130122/48991_1 /TAXON_ID=2925 /ORGANISM="Alexandrium catenella, Strain OF101" /LENGTH=88 /DNA_ID=CAMNT_0011715839 /DNA_START=52 /DNA_END=315 /DNA_ORIENTATION=+
MGDTGLVSTERVIFACFFSSLISLLMIVMVNLADQTENPFKHGNRDTIDVKGEMNLARQAIKNANEDKERPWYEAEVFDWESEEASAE